MNAPALSPGAAAVMRRLNGADYQAYLVGGCVRDALLGRPVHDHDLCTDATPEQMLACLTGLRVIPTGIAHGTLTVLCDGEAIEVTTFRCDGAYAPDHRHPQQVRFVPSLEEDLRRRDFTVNAMAWHPDTGLIDPFGGRQDLQAGVLRCVGDPAQRLREDALRILRGLRFAAHYQWSPEPQTAAAMHQLRGLLSHISGERIFSELKGWLAAPDPSQTLLTFADVVSTILPELAPAVGFDQKSRYHCYDVYTHSVYALCRVPPEPEPVRLALLLHDSGKPSCCTEQDGVRHFYGHAAESERLARQALTRLKADRRTLDTVALLVRRHDDPIEPTPAAVRRWLNRLGEDTLRKLLLVKMGDTLAHAPATTVPRRRAVEQAGRVLDQVIAARDCFSLKDLAVGGQDLLALGFAPGPALGSVLQTLLAQVVDGALPNERTALLAAAEQLRTEP